MAKAKKSKKANSDAVYAKKAGLEKHNPFATAVAATSKKHNPFEVHLNKEKFQILGRTCKHDKGLPGVSRAKAVKKRMQTLGQEFHNKDKSNQFRDRRIGRHLDDAQLNEEVMNARFLAEKMSHARKTSRFNLNDDEVLTHRGQTLEEIEQFHDDRSDDGDADEEELNAEFTEAAHFGGDTGQVIDRKTAIDEMIIEQKRRKVELAREKDELNVLTERLDTNYKELLGLVGKMKKSDIKATPSTDDYDKVLREMVFEPRGAVADKLLSEEEIAKREKEKLEQLENERLRRMQGDDEDLKAQSKPKHRSADDLDDGYFANGEVEEENTLAYNLDGELDTKFTANELEKDTKETEDSQDEISGQEDGETEEENEEADSDKSENSNEESEEYDNLSDLKEISDSEVEEDNIPKKRTVTRKILIKNNENMKDPENINDLPFTMELPSSYDEFIALFEKRTPIQHALIVERLIKCNNPKLEGVNRETIVKLFVFLLRYVDELFADASHMDVTVNFKILDSINPQLFDLVHLNPEKMSQVMLKIIKEKYSIYRKNPRFFPTLETIVIFKLVSNLYSTSDFRHPIVSPCYIFMQHILSKARIRTRQDVALGLFIVTLVLEFSQQSKRYLPAAFNFLLGVIYISIPKRSIEVIKILQPFQSTGPMSKLLALPENLEPVKLQEQLLNSEDLVTTTISLEFKIIALNTTLKLIIDAITTISEKVGANYLAEPLLEMLERLPLQVYPEFVHKNYATAKETLQRVASKALKKIVPPEKKPKALRLLEPRIETVYDDKRRPKLTKEKEERVKLMHKLKRETKGAVREIRRDTEFLQKMRLQQQMQSDKERKEKVKRIYQEASVQQGELNEMARAKKKKKF